MASITLSGTLLDPNGQFAVGDKIRFIHDTTTGDVVKSAASIVTVPPNGEYNIELQYGLIKVDYQDYTRENFTNLGVITVNQDSTATTLPELLNSLVPPTDDQLLLFQDILADCIEAKEDAEQAAQDAAQSAQDAAQSAQANALVFQTLAELQAYTPLAGQENLSYKVANDPDFDNNGYYSYNGSAYIKDANLYTESVSTTATEGLSSAGGYVIQSPYKVNGGVPSQEASAIKAIKLYGAVEPGKRYGVAVVRKNASSGLWEVAIYTYNYNSSTPVRNVARFSKENYTPSASREWVFAESITGLPASERSVSAEIYIDWDELPNGANATGLSIDDHEIDVNKCFVSLEELAQGVEFGLATSANRTGVTVSGGEININGLVMKSRASNHFVYINAVGDETQSNLASTSMKIYPLTDPDVISPNERDVLIYADIKKFWEANRGANISLDAVDDAQWYEVDNLGKVTMLTTSERENKNSWCGKLPELVRQTGWNDAGFVNPSAATFGLATSNFSGNGGITVTNSVLEIGSLILSLAGSSKYVYLSLDIAAVPDGTNRSQLDLSALQSASYLYVTTTDIEAASTGGTIEVRVKRTWFGEQGADDIVLGYVQTPGDAISYSGKLFDMVYNVGWSDPNYNPSNVDIPLPDYFNLESMSNFRQETAIIDGGFNTKSIVVGLHGDSWTHKTDEFTKYTTFISRALRERYGNAGGGWYDFAASTGANFMRSIDPNDASDTRAGSINYIDEGSTALGVNCAHAEMAQGSTIQLNVLTNHNRFIIHYYGKSGGGTFSYSIDGNAAVQVDTSLTTGYQTIELNASLSGHTLVFVSVSGNCIVLGVDMQITGVSGARVHKFGNRGLRAADVADVADWSSHVEKFNIESWTCLLGTNEKTIGTAPDTYKNDMKYIYDQVLSVAPGVDYCFIGPSYTKQTTNTYTPEQYAKKLYELAIENKCAFFNMIPLFGDTNKILERDTFYDSVHPRIESGYMMAQRLCSTVFPVQPPAITNN